SLWVARRESMTAVQASREARLAANSRIGAAANAGSAGVAAGVTAGGVTAGGVTAGGVTAGNGASTQGGIAPSTPNSGPYAPGFQRWTASLKASSKGPDPFSQKGSGLFSEKGSGPFPKKGSEHY